MLPLRESALSTISCLHSTVAHVLNAYEADKPANFPGEGEDKDSPSKTLPTHSTIPNASIKPETSAETIVSQQENEQLNPEESGGASQGENNTNPTRRSLLVRKPQGFIAENGASTNATGGVTAVPNTGNIQKIHAPLPGETAATNPVTSSETSLDAGEDSSPSTKLAPALEKLHMPGVRARTSRFRRVRKTAVSQLKQPHRSEEHQGKAQRADKRGSRWGRWVRAGWIPAQEGAYAMALLPYWIGVIESSLRPIHWLVFALWICGYFTFNVGGIWLRSRRKDRYFKPVQIYGAITLVLGVISLLVAPPLLEWTLVFFPLIAIAVIESVLHRERSLLARTSTILATGVMSLVSYDIGTQFSRSFAAISWLEHTATSNVNWVVSPTGNLQGWGWMLVVAWVVTSYYWSTIPYVRSLVRRRGSQTFWFFSIGAHAVLTAVILGFFILGWVTWWHLLVWVLLWGRSIAVPLWQKKHPRAVTVSRIGFAEIAVAMLVIITLLV